MDHLRALGAAGRWALFVVAYVLSDLFSGPEARYQLIAPVWHPAAGLAMYALARHGRRALAPLAIAALLAAAITPALPARPGYSLLIGLAPLPACLLAGWFTRRVLPDGAFFGSHGGMLRWAAVVTLGSAASALLYAAMLTESVAPADGAWLAIVTRYTVAEIAGMLVLAPAAYCLLDARRRQEAVRRVLTWESLGYSALIALVLSIALQRPAPESFAYHLLILPLAWAAARQGMSGALAAAIVLEAGVTIAALRPLAYAAGMPNVQMLVLTLTVSGFLIGIAVDAARQASDDLRHSLRLAAAAEMAAALAHELNQPLTALSAYGSACQRLLAKDPADPRLADTVRAMAAQSQRASDVLKRLRELFRSGATRAEPIAVPELLQACSAAVAKEAAAQQVLVEVDVDARAPLRLLGDRLQLEIVLRNLLVNAIQALAEQPAGLERRITVAAGADQGQVWIRVADTGPGIAESIRARLFEPFVSLKSSGLGLGLALSRAIVEAHGGSLSARPGRHAVLTVTLPAMSTPLRSTADGT